MDFTIQLNPRAFQPLHLQQCFRILFPVGNASKMVIQRNNLVQRKDDPLRIVSVRGLVLADHDGIVEVEDLKVILFVNDQVSWGDVLVHYAVLVVEVVYHGKELSESLNTEWTARGVIVMQRAAFDEYSGKPDSSSPDRIEVNRVERDNVRVVARQSTPAVQLVPCPKHGVLHKPILERGCCFRRCGADGW